MWLTQCSRAAEVGIICAIAYVLGMLGGWWPYPGENASRLKYERRRRTVEAIRALKDLDSDYHHVNGSFVESIAVLARWGLTDPARGAEQWRRTKPVYMSFDDLVIDSWGHEILIIKKNGMRAIISAGPDGVLGNQDDISSQSL